MRRLLLLLLPLTLCSVGCFSWRSGTIAAFELPPEMQAEAPRQVTSFHLGALASPVQGEYRIQPGDLLDVSVSDLVKENQTYTMPARVQEDGTVQLPLVGSVAVNSLTEQESEKVIFASYSGGGLLQKPQVLVSLRQPHKVRVFLLGAVNKPGQYELAGNESDLLSALVAAGGLTPAAGTVVEIRHRAAHDSLPGLHNGERQPVLPHGSLSTKAANEAAAPPAVRAQAPSTDDGPTLAVAGDGFDRVPPPPFPRRKLRVAPAEGPFLTVPDSPPIEQPDKLPDSIRDDSFPRATDAAARERRLGSQGPAPQECPPGTSAPASAVKAGSGTGDALKPLYVVGLVKNPGEYPFPLSSQVRVLDAIELAGGLDESKPATRAVVIHDHADEAGATPVWIDLARARQNPKENIHLLPGDVLNVHRERSMPAVVVAGHAEPATADVAAAPASAIQVVRLDLAGSTDQETLRQGIHLQNGDIITVEEQKLKPIYVIGMVNKPGEYPLPPGRDIRVLEAIGLAGGVDKSSLPDKLVVIRQRPNAAGLVSVRIDLNDAKHDMNENIRLMPGDTVSVEETGMSYMRSMLRNAVHFGVGASLIPVF